MKILKYMERVRNEYFNQLFMKIKVCKMELQENIEFIEDKIVYFKRCRKLLNDFIVEIRDVQYVWEFYEIGKKYNMFKIFYDRDKFCLFLVSLEFYFVVQDIEGMNFLGGVVIMKRCISLVYVLKKIKRFKNKKYSIVGLDLF